MDLLRNQLKLVNKYQINQESLLLRLSNTHLTNEVHGWYTGKYETSTPTPPLHHSFIRTLSLFNRERLKSETDCNDY